MATRNKQDSIDAIDGSTPANKPKHKGNMFIEQRELSIKLPDGAELYFWEPTREDVIAELKLFQNPNPMAKVEIKKMLYMDLFSRVDPPSSIYHPNNHSKSRSARQDFMGYLANGLVAPSPLEIQSYPEKMWIIGDTELREMGKGIYLKYSSFDYLAISAKLESGDPMTLLETSESVCELALEREFGQIPEQADFMPVRAFVKQYGELLGVHYQQLVTITANFLQTFTSARRKF